MRRIAIAFTRFIICSIAALSTRQVMADSIYDGIWQYEGGSYFSLTITGEQAVLVSLSEVARYQDPLKGAYLGAVLTNVGTSYPAAVLRAYLKTDLKPIDRFFFSWEIYFFSKSDAVMQRTAADYPNAEVAPFLPLRKVF